MARLRLKFVNSFRDRHGRVRHYFRRPGSKAIALLGLPGSAEFMDAYQTALAGAPIRDIGASRTKAGTVNAAVAAYYRSKSFTQALAPATQRMRRNILERFRTEHGDKRIVLLQRNHIVKLLETMRPYAQKNWLKTIRGLMAFAITDNMIANDPSEGVKAMRVAKSIGHMTWLEPQVAMYRTHHPIGTMARLAIELLLNIAARRDDAHALGYQHISDGRLCWRPRKTQRSTSKLLKVKIMPEFQEALDAMPRSENVLTFLTNDYGKPFASAAAFGNKFADWCKAAGLQPVLCDDGRIRNFRAHGLRKAALRTLAHAGCTGSEMMQVSGHSSLKQLQEYLDEVDQEHQADSAMAKLKNKMRG
jgi:integrase/recombinase XerD